MPLILIRNDITKMETDAIVNAANSSLLGGGGVDGAIHRAAGPELLAECRTLGGCETGSAKVTRAYRLPSKYIIHTVGPVWQGGDHGEEALLRSCYRTSLRLAEEKGCETVAFPLISSGIFGYPKREALRIAEETIRDFLLTSEMTVYLVIFDRDAFRLSVERYEDIAAYVDDQYVDEHLDRNSSRNELNFLGTMWKAAKPRRKQAREGAEALPMAEALSMAEADVPSDAVAAPMAPASLEDALRSLDESFSQMLLRKITESGMTDAQCYKKANIDRKLFSKIRSDPQYKPSKPTALAFAIALELPLWEAKDLLLKAGFALSRSSRFDVIVEYFLARGEYDILHINEALFAFDQPLLGC